LVLLQNEKTLKLAVLLPVVGGDSVSDLQASVASVLAQSHSRFQLFVLLTGNASDALVGYVRSLGQGDDRVSVTIKAQRYSAARARNYLMDHATANAWAFVDSDDRWFCDHLADFVTSYRPDTSIFYFADYCFAQSRHRVSFLPIRRSLWYLLRQPILLSSVIIANRKQVFPNINAEDFAFCHKGLTEFETVIHNPQVRVIYDQKRTQRKGIWFRLKRTYLLMREIVGNRIYAQFLTLVFVIRSMLRAARHR